MQNTGNSPAEASWNRCADWARSLRKTWRVASFHCWFLGQWWLGNETWRSCRVRTDIHTL